MAEIVARVYRERAGYRALVDGWGTFRGTTLVQTIRRTKLGLEGVVAGAFPDRPGIDPQGAELVVHFKLELKSAHRPETARKPGLAGRKIRTS